MSSLTEGMSLREASDLQEIALQHTLQAESLLQMEGHAIPIIACTGALILGRAAFYAHMQLPGQIKPYRQLAHAMLAEVLDVVELMMTKTEGRA